MGLDGWLLVLISKTNAPQHLRSASGAALRPQDTGKSAGRHPANSAGRVGSLASETRAFTVGRFWLLVTPLWEFWPLGGSVLFGNPFAR